MISGITGGNHQAPTAAPTAAADTGLTGAVGTTQAKDPVVLPAVANPKTKAQQDQLGSGVDRDPVTGRSIVRIRTQGDNDNIAATQVAQKVAVAWGSYVHTMSPKEFVDSLPNKAPGADAAFLNAIKDQWPAIQKKEVTSTAKLTGVTPIVQTLNEKQGVATVSVKVDQTKSGAGETGSKTVTFVVQMSRFEESREEPPNGSEPDKSIISKTAWGVIGVRQQ